MTKEVCIYPSQVLSYNWPEGDKRHGKLGRIIDNDCYLNAVKKRKVGDTTYAFAGAPGTGRIVHRITRIDAEGVYGVEIENTIRELRPSEVI